MLLKQVSSNDCKFANVHNPENAAVGRSREGKVYIDVHANCSSADVRCDLHMLLWQRMATLNHQQRWQTRV